MLALTLITTAFAEVPPASASWTLLQETPVRIECTTWQSKPYCRSTGVIGTPVANASSVFAQLDKYVSKMGAISLVQRLEPDVLHVVMDYPFPLSDRDYVARFTHHTEADGTEVYAWSPVTHAAAPETSGIVRLTWLDGQWRFSAEGSSTRVTYIWEANPGGGLPDVNAVYKQAGTLAIQDMANACSTQVLSP